MAIVGLVCGVLYSVGGFCVDLFTTGLNWGTAMAFMALVGMPVIFGAAGFVLGALIALVVRGVKAVLGRRGRQDR
jgi:poly(3-hydroxybutyrate) depolymerase